MSQKPHPINVYNNFLFFPKIFEMERSALQATILEKCQIYLASGGQFERRREKKSRENVLLI